MNTDAEMVEAQAWCDWLLAADRGAYASGELLHDIERKNVLAILRRVRDAVARLLECYAASSGALQSTPVQRLR